MSKVITSPPTCPIACFWQQPWGWQQAILIQAALILMATALQWRLAGVNLPEIPAPWNWTLLFGFVILLGVLEIRYRQSPWMRWLSGMPFAVTSIAFAAGISLLGTLFVQDPQQTDLLSRLGLRQVFTSFPFLTAGLLMMVNLSVVLCRRCIPWRAGNIGFLLNHAGLLLVLLGIIAGSAQFARTTLELHEGFPSRIAMDASNRSFDLGAAVTLNRFSLESFPPKLALVKVDETDPRGYRVIDSSNWIKQGLQLKLASDTVQVQRYLPAALPDKPQGWSAVSAEMRHAVPVAHLKVQNAAGGVSQGWVTCGNAVIRPRYLRLDNEYAILMAKSAPKNYRSELTVAEPGKPPESKVLEVNRPVQVGPWRLYQASYDEKLGNLSTVSVLEAVRDPALPVVYLGLAAMLLGCFLTLWTAIPPSTEEQRPQKASIKESP